MNPWNTKMIIEFDENYANQIRDYYQSSRFKGYKKEKQKELRSKLIKPNLAFKYLEDKYNEGYGIKVLARHIGLSYTQLRVLMEMDEINICIRRGQNVVTDKVIDFRSKRVQGDKNPWHNWPKRDPESHKKTTSRGVQGYYQRKWDNELVWLRSSWEYTYAKWLDTQNIKWQFETKQFKFSNGEFYRPDFWILDESSECLYIVEIKGYFDCRAYKHKLLEEEFNIKTILIKDISKYLQQSYRKELEEWKQLRKLSKDV